MSSDGEDLLKPRRGRWDGAKFAKRTPLSTIVARNVRIVRAPVGTTHWKQGLLLVEDAETGDLLATVPAGGFCDPKTGWNLRLDC